MDVLLYRIFLLKRILLCSEGDEVGRNSDGGVGKLKPQLDGRMLTIILNRATLEIEIVVEHFVSWI